MRAITEENIAQAIDRFRTSCERLCKILKSGCRCLVNTTIGETTECEVCKKARENIQ